MFEEKKQEVASEFSTRLDRYSSDAYFGLILLICPALLIAFWAFSIIFPESASLVFGLVTAPDLGKYLLFLVVFVPGFMLAKVILRRIFMRGMPVRVEDGPFNSYSSAARSERNWQLWIASGAISAFHTILFFVYLISLEDVEIFQ